MVMSPIESTSILSIPRGPSVVRTASAIARAAAILLCVALLSRARSVPSFKMRIGVPCIMVSTNAGRRALLYNTTSKLGFGILFGAAAGPLTELELVEWMGDGTFDPEAFHAYVLALAAVPRTRKSAPNRTGFPGTSARPVASPPRQKHQVGRFLCFPEKRLACRAHFRTHGQTTDKVSDLARPSGYRKVRWDFSRADPVPETKFHQRHAPSRSVQ